MSRLRRRGWVLLSFPLSSYLGPQRSGGAHTGKGHLLCSVHGLRCRSIPETPPQRPPGGRAISQGTRRPHGGTARCSRSLPAAPRGSAPLQPHYCSSPPALPQHCLPLLAAALETFGSIRMKICWSGVCPVLLERHRGGLVCSQHLPNGADPSAGSTCRGWFKPGFPCTRLSSPPLMRFSLSQPSRHCTQGVVLTPSLPRPSSEASASLL